ncbi:MAG: aminopeptidase, partial [Acidobacteria bacterium]|nr:aminopeptidase [Acidobacteriota bacterium]
MKSILLALLTCSSLLAQAPALEETALRAHLAFLADDVLEGRGTGQRGGELAVRYLETQLQALGLQPVGAGGYRQKVRLAGIRLEASTTFRFEGPGGALTPALGTDMALGPAAAEAQVAVDAPLVFVGHGISDTQRDDYKGLDVRGRILVML